MDVESTDSDLAAPIQSVSHMICMTCQQGQKGQQHGVLVLLLDSQSQIPYVRALSKRFLGIIPFLRREAHHVVFYNVMMADNKTRRRYLAEARKLGKDF